MKRCAFLSMDSLDDFEAYDFLVEPYLKTLGWETDTVSWRKSGVDWSIYDLVVIRTPWDYQDEPEAFLDVLSTIEQSAAILENSLAVVKWNIDKEYLKQLASLGVNIVPTLWHDRLSGVQLKTQHITDLREQLRSEQIVLKPRVSANADNTFWLKGNLTESVLGDMNEAFEERDFMIQPFLSNVISEGEYSLFYFNGQYSHAILKTPQQGDFRVQEEHGGQLKAVEPETALMQAATQTIEAIGQLHGSLLYARVDYVRIGDSFALMEAELIEPSLYFNMDDASPERFALAIDKRFTD